MAVDLKPILRGVLSAASSALIEAGVPTGRVELTPGNLPAWDDCCEGQLYLRVIEIFPAAPFPQFDANQRGAAGALCAINMLDVHIGLGVIRCAHKIDDDLKAPTPEEVTGDGEEMVDDAMILLNTILCDLKGIKGIMQMKLDRWAPQGVNGGCHGGEWGIHLAVDPCVQCP